ncbi:phage tail protein [Aestuariicella hydrocarbonica]|uniref:Phage tail protein n=1 Tax=Pseudomaricurvus hydrocarbonicus TaxID=1470433 RepID=A0A9E5JQH8_9GAMM|nr:phage tail tube protein [Aestuariicella hydrocarbonica]NHO64619.1 phage tail protein [Aestuariicella hydrocarbonica]
MSVLTQGTQIYFIDDSGSAPVIVEVGCVTTFTPGGNPSDQLDDTCLSATTRSYKPGLRTPAAATIGLRPDPTDESHILLHALSETDPSPTLKWAVGWSDGIDIVPTLNSAGDDFELPDTRTWFIFDGYISDFPFDFSGNTLVSGDMAVQRSGGSEWIAKV